MDYLLWIVLGIVFLIMLIYYGSKEKPIVYAIGSMILGLAILMLLHYCGNSIGFTPQINFFNTMLVLILGVPSILLIFISELI